MALIIVLTITIDANLWKTQFNTHTRERLRFYAINLEIVTFYCMESVVFP
jgi:hypothetical protein